jgi:hypothetical protein
MAISKRISGPESIFNSHYEEINSITPLSPTEVILGTGAIAGSGFGSLPLMDSSEPGKWTAVANSDGI